jgi:hypothetical protein
LTLAANTNTLLGMKLTLQLQLLPAPAQAEALRTTVERFNEAATWLADIALQQQCANKIALQKLAYYELWARFGLPAEGRHVEASSFPQGIAVNFLKGIWGCTPRRNIPCGKGEHPLSVGVALDGQRFVERYGTAITIPLGLAERRLRDKGVTWMCTIKSRTLRSRQ